MNIGRAESVLNELLDVELAEEWDNPGLSVAERDRTLSGLLICVDPSLEALDRAIEEDLNLIVAHHPLLIDSIDSVVDNTPQKRAIIQAIKNEVAIYGAHTNVDSMAGGLNDEFVKIFELRQPEPIVPSDEDPSAGLGRVGSLPDTMSLREAETCLREELDPSKMESLGDPDTTIERIAVCTGSGGDFITHPDVQEADLYVTADVKHHEAMDARQSDLALINLDHYEMESVFIPIVEERCRQRFDGVPIEIFRRTNPFRRQGNSE